jgi:hypothetical protein
MTLQGGSFLAPVAIRIKLNNEGRLVCPGKKQSKQEEQIFRVSRLNPSMGNRIFPVLATSTQIALDHNPALKSEPQRAESDMDLQCHCTAMSSSRRTRMIFTASFRSCSGRYDFKVTHHHLRPGLQQIGSCTSYASEQKNVRSRASGQSDLVYITGRSDLDLVSPPSSGAHLISIRSPLHIVRFSSPRPFP